MQTETRQWKQPCMRSEKPQASVVNNRSQRTNAKKRQPRDSATTITSTTDAPISPILCIEQSGSTIARCSTKITHNVYGSRVWMPRHEGPLSVVWWGTSPSLKHQPYTEGSEGSVTQNDTGHTPHSPPKGRVWPEPRPLSSTGAPGPRLHTTFPQG